MVRSHLSPLARSMAAVATCLVAVAQPAFAADNGDADKIVVEGAKPQTKKICKVETKLGSNLPRRTCREVGADEANKLNGLDQLREARDAQQNTQRAAGPL